MISYPFLPSTPKGNYSPTLNPEKFQQLKESKDTPMITRWIANSMEDPEERREKLHYHLALQKREADKRMAIDEVERPRKIRMGSYE
jgi:hypothetical protein